MDGFHDDMLALSPEQTDKVLQFQDLTGIEDMTICRDVLQRHQWDLEVAIQEQLNIREGRPSVYATEARPPAVVMDHVAQQIFTEDPPEPPGGVRGLFSYVVNLVVSVCYNTVTSILNLLLNFVRQDRRLVTDPLGDVVRFIQNYNSRYPAHPVFYQGTYAQALNDAKNELRFLVVYLHSDAAPETQSFCRNTLSDPEVIDYINTNALFWACSVDSGEGWRVMQSTGARRHPFLCIVCLREHRMTVVARSEGPCSPAQLLSRLQRVMNDNENHLAMERADRVEREMTAQLRAQQDVAYAESLAVDQEKERRKAAEREARRTQEQAERDKIQEELRRLQELAAERVTMSQNLPPEPTADGLSLLIRLPNGERLTRRFNHAQPVTDLYNFVFSHPDAPEQFEITTNFPKRIIRKSSVCLSEAGLKDRDVLFVYDNDA